MYVLPNKTNRFQLSFFFNEKEFELAKFQSIKSAQNLWELLSRIRKGDAYLTELEELRNFASRSSLESSRNVLNLNEVENESKISN